jgi:hypothetical protein
MAAGMGGDRDDIGATTDTDIAGMADPVGDVADHRVGAVDQRSGKAIEMADLIEQQRGPVALALADRLQQPSSRIARSRREALLFGMPSKVTRSVTVTSWRVLEKQRSTSTADDRMDIVADP